MGYYVNPRNNLTKEAWLRDNGILVQRKEITSYEGALELDCLPVCLVNNGSFTAAAICYSPQELAVFSNPADARPKLWFLVPIKVLVEAEPALAKVMENPRAYDRGVY